MLNRSSTAPLRTLAATLCLGLIGAVLVPAAAGASQQVVVGTTPDFKQPRILDGHVYSIDAAGSTTAVGGDFTRIRNGAYNTPEIAQSGLFLFDSETGQIDESFRPDLNGAVEAVQFAPDGETLYVAGDFTTLDGLSRRRIVRLDLEGNPVPGFRASANSRVLEIELVGDRLIIGGQFGQVNDQPVMSLASLDPETGATQTDFNLPAWQPRSIYHPFVQEMDASADGRWLVFSGNFTRVGTQPRNQIAIVDLHGTPSVANWSTDRYRETCGPHAGSWIRGIDIAPDSSWFVVNTTGGHKNSTALCDTATRWELPPARVGDGQEPTWTEWTGGDTLWAAEITDAAVYVGGHQRWQNNRFPSPRGDSDGPGSVARPGIAALDPLTGVPLSWNPTRDRGKGVEAFLATDDHLMVGHDTNLFGGEIRQRLALLPTAGGTSNPMPEKVELPVTLYATEGGSTLRRATFDGTHVSPWTTVDSSAHWSAMRGGFVQHGRLHYFGPSQAFWRRPFAGAPSGTATNLSTSVGYVDTSHNLTPYDQPYGVAETRAAAYSHGRIYYLKQGDPRMHWRGYSLESGIIGSPEWVASSLNYSNVRAMTAIGDWLYLAWSNGDLTRMLLRDGLPDASTATLVGTRASTGTDWSKVTGLWAEQSGEDTTPLPTPAAPTCSGASPWLAEYWANTGLEGGRAAVRCEASVDYDFGSGGPVGLSNSVGTNSFSARWTRTVTLAQAGALQVRATHDDGARVYVDGVRIIDQWSDGSRTSTATSQPLAPGEHTITMEHYENAGSAQARLTYDTVAAPDAPQPPDNLPPESALTSPGRAEQLASTTVTASGTASDNRGVTAVRVGIFDRAEQRWLQPNGTWAANYAHRPATLAQPGAADTAWSLSVTLPEGIYSIDVRSVDAAGNVDPTPVFSPFRIDTTPPDTVAPETDVTSPQQGELITTHRFTATGTASDDTALSQVRVAVYDRGNPETPWLQTDGTWATTYAFRLATLHPDGDWELDLNLPDGAYALDARARDAGGNLDPTPIWRPFRVDSTPPDTIAPESEVHSPQRNAVLAPGRVVLSGVAADDRRVSQVRIAVRNESTGLWRQSDGSWAATYAFAAADLTDPDSSRTDWSWELTLPTGRYGFDVKARDAAGNLDASPSWIPVTID